MFREHILKKDTLPCLIVKSSSGEKEESVRKKDINLSAEKESLKGSRKEQTVGKSVKERKTLKGQLKKNPYKVLKLESCQERSQRVIPNLCLRGITSSSLKRTPVLAAGFQLEGSLCHITKAARHYAA